MIASAVIVPWWGLSWAGVSSIHSWPTPPTPFGFNRLALAQLVLTLPLSWVVSQFLPVPKWNQASSTLLRPSLLAAVVGCLFSLGARFIIFPPDMVSGTTATVVRILWTLVLQVPWCFAVRCGDTTESAWAEFAWAKSSGVGISLVIATLWAIVPQCYVDSICRKEEASIGDSLRNGFTWDAAQRVDSVLRTGARAKILDQEPTEILAALVGEIQRASHETDQPLPQTATEGERFQRSQRWMQLGELTKAKQMLDSMPSSPHAQLLSSVIAEELGDWSAAIQSCRAVLEPLQQPQFADERNRLSNNARERLANNLRRIGKYQEAEQMLRQAVAGGGPTVGTSHYHLGTHLRNGGRLREAISQFEKAAELDPKLGDVVSAAMAAIASESSGSGCIFRQTRQVTR